MWRRTVQFVGNHKRKLGATLVMVLVVVAPYSVVLVAQHYKHTNLHAAADCTPNATLVNPCRPWLGAYSNKHGEVASDLKSQLLYHEQLIGRQVDVVHDYAREGNVLSSFDIYAATRANTTLFLNYKPAGNWADASGGNATVNAEIDKMAASIKNNLGSKKMFMTIWHEPENDLGSDSNCPNTSFKGPSMNTTSAYKAMWQNVRSRFQADGVTNVVWAMDYMNYPAWSCVVPDLYPGDSLVDWIVFNGYAKGAGNWNNNISRFYNWLANNSTSAHNYASKTWGIVEWGILNSTQAQAYDYYDQVKASLDANTFPKLKLYMIFDSIGPPDYTPGGQIETGSNLVFDQTEVNHYKALANDPIFSSVTLTGGGGDTAPPTVSVTAPASGATISGTVNVTAAAADNIGVSKVVFAVDGAVASTDTAAPFSAAIDTTRYGNGSHTFTATAYDAAGNHTSSSVGVNINNATPPPGTDTTSPVVSITSPAPGATVGKTITFSANATDNVGVAKVIFIVDTTVVATDTAAPYSVQLDTAMYTNGSHTLRAKAFDAAGNARTPLINVTFSNVGTLPNPSILSFTPSSSSITVGNAVTLKWTSTNAVYCSVDPDGPQKSSLTSWTTAPFTSTETKTYTLTCYNSIGKSVTAKATVTVNSAPHPPAKPSVSADKTAIQAGGNVLISWNSSSAEDCTLNPGNITSLGSSGSKLIEDIQQTTTFTVVCANNAGSSSNSIQVVVSPRPVNPGPVINSFMIQPASVSAGGNATLTWSTSNVATNGCVIVPSPLTSAAANGSWQTAPLSASVSYTLTCKGFSGLPANRSVSVTVNGSTAPNPPAPAASSDSPVSTATVQALGGQTVVNAQSQDTVKKGDLVTLDPGNVLDEKKALNIARVEYYNGEKLIQTVSEPPYALNTKSLSAGTYTLTERTYYDDGSMSERTQDITVKNTAALTDKKGSGTHTGLVVALGLVVFAGAVAVYIIRRVRLSQATAPAMLSALSPDEIIVAPQAPAEDSNNPPNWPPAGTLQS